MMERVRIEEFILEGKNFIYLDMSDLKTSKGFSELVKIAEPAIAKYPEGSLYTITNVENARFDTEVKMLLVNYLKHNKPYVKYWAIIGVDGIKKVVANTLLALSGRAKPLFAFTKEQAVEFLLEKG